MVEVLENFIEVPRRFGDFSEKDYFISTMWDETNDLKKTHTLCDNVHYPEAPLDLIYSGSHLHLLNPVFKTARAVCKLNSDFDNVDLTSIGENYKGLKTIDSNITFYQNINAVDSPVYLEIPHKIIKNDFTLDQPIFTNLYIKNKYYSIYRIDKEYCGEFTIKFNKDIQ